MGDFAPVEGVRRIAVVRANSLGDMIFALPALEALRAAYPAAEIVLLARAWHRDFFAGRPGPIDRVVVLPPYGGVGAAEAVGDDSLEIRSFFAAMRDERFDLAVQMHGGGRYSNPFVRRLGARVSVGLATPDAPPLDRTVPYVYYQSEVMRYLDVAEAAGAGIVVREPRLTLIPADWAALRGVHSWGDAPLAVLHPGASDPRRRWPVEHFAAVGDALAVSGYHVALVGIPDEGALVAGIRAAMTAPSSDLCGALSLGGLAALLATSAVVIANDSGPLHLAAAVGARTVGIYWVGNLINAGPQSRLRHHPVIAWRMTCPVCGAHFADDPPCPHDASVVAEVPPAEVIEAARAVVAAGW